MIIKDLKDLEKLVKLCQKQGISAFELDGLKFNLTLQPKAAPRSRKSVLNDIPEANLVIPQYNNQPDNIETDELTPEQLLFYSAPSDETEDRAQ